MRVKHILVTSFNRWLKAGSTFTKGLDNDWLNYRWKIFTRFTVPSIAGQSNNDFDWVIMCHERSPTWLRERAKTLELPCRVRFSFNQNDPALDDLNDPSLDAVLSTRIDSDDAFHRCAMARVRESFEADPYSYEILNFEIGYQYDSLGERLAVVRRISPPFGTKINLPPILDPLDTGGRHDTLHKKYVYKNISHGDPMFLIVIHDANIQSKIYPTASFASRSLSQHSLREAFNITPHLKSQEEVVEKTTKLRD